MSGVNLDAWVLKMRARDPTLSSEENEVLRDSVKEVVQIEADRDIVREQDRCDQSHLLLRGWACRYLTLADGRRQIVALHLPGDFVDLHSFPLKTMDHSVATLTPCAIAVVPHERLKRITETRPHLTRVLWLSTLIDAAILRQWMLGAGRRSAVERTAHLFCEMFMRLRTIDAVEGARFAFPLTQLELADALGVTAVHTNRVIQGLKRSNMLSWRGQVVEILDLQRLRRMAEFDPTYLSVEPEPR
jgi:CRP-like cAMP-binding protein